MCAVVGLRTAHNAARTRAHTLKVLAPRTTMHYSAAWIRGGNGLFDGIEKQIFMGEIIIWNLGLISFNIFRRNTNTAQCYWPCLYRRYTGTVGIAHSLIYQMTRYLKISKLN